MDERSDGVPVDSIEVRTDERSVSHVLAERIRAELDMQEARRRYSEDERATWQDPGAPTYEELARTRTPRRPLFFKRRPWVEGVRVGMGTPFWRYVPFWKLFAARRKRD